jgi:hypothetical protein
MASIIPKTETITEPEKKPSFDYQHAITWIGFFLGGVSLIIPLFFIATKYDLSDGGTGAQGPINPLVFFGFTFLVILVYTVAVTYISYANVSVLEDKKYVYSLPSIIGFTVAAGLLVIGLALLYSFTMWKYVVKDEKLNITSIAMYGLSLLTLILVFLWGLYIRKRNIIFTTTGSIIVKHRPEKKEQQQQKEEKFTLTAEQQ